MQWAEAEKISYLVYSPESELSYDLFAIMDKLELIGSMGSYYDAYRLLRTQPLSGRYVLEELTVLTAASPKMRKEQRLKQLDGYRTYTRICASAGKSICVTMDWQRFPGKTQSI